MRHTEACSLRSLMAGGCICYATPKEPAPDHTPAVRRVVAYVGDDDEPPRLDPADAYADAADLLIQQAWELRGSWSGIGEGDFFDYFPPGRKHILAQMLRLRDENAGYR